MNDLFDMGYLSGSIEAIAPVANVIGTICMWIISLVGFAIVMSSIAKNSMHGLYAANTKLWDRVYEVKMASIRSSGGLKGILDSEAAGKMTGGSNNDITKFMGSITALGMSLLPNVKAMTDFEDSLMDAKSYFMKAIPMMCVAIFIGVFIWLGYPASVAEKFSEFATATVDMVLINVDPAGWVESIPGELSILSFSTDGAKDDMSVFENKIAKEAAKTTVGAFSSSNITAEARRATALSVETWVMQFVSDSCAEYCDSEKYKMSVSASVYKDGPPPDSKVQNGVANNDGIVAFVFSKAVGDFPTGTNIDISKWYLRVYLEFKPVAMKNTKAAKTVTLNTSGWVANDNNRNELSIKVSDEQGSASFEKRSVMRGTVYVGEDSKKVTVEIQVINETTIKLKAPTDVDISGIDTVTEVQGLSYVYGNNKHKIKTISKSADGTSFVPDDGSSSWGWGSGPE